MVNPTLLRVLLADDHGLVRAGLRKLLDGLPGVEVVAEARDGAEALRLVEECRPDVALLDIAMPVMTGLAALREVRSRFPATQVILLSMYDNREYVVEAVQAGASGFLVKDAAVEELAVALDAVRRGDRYLSPGVARHLAQAFAARVSEPEAGTEGPLTARQTEVLCFVAEGRSSKEIAQRLGLSVKTVETHRAQIMVRLGIRDLASLVRYAVRNGLVSS